MKKYSHLVVFVFLILGKLSFCDVIPANCHSASMCVKITNISDYPEISLIGFYIDGVCPCKTAYEIVSSECLHAGSQFDSHYIYATKESYITGKDLKTINWAKDFNAVKSNIYISPRRVLVPDSLSIFSIEQFYKILGFTDSSVVLFKWKEITMDKDGNQFSYIEYFYEGDILKLRQKIRAGISSVLNISTFTLYPNPTKQNVSLKINNFYQGSVPVEIISFGGKLMKSLSLSKTGFIYDSVIPIENLPKGIYFVTLRFGAMVETQKLIIN